MDSTHLIFRTSIATTKPESIRNRETKCPFCDLGALEEILAEDGSIRLVKNKYPVLVDTFQTVLIESDQCDLDISTYSKAHLYRLIRFGVREWLGMEASGEYRSVLFYKNHGPLSGGTIHHPHMQIIGLKHMNYMIEIKEEQFKGMVIEKEMGVECNISTKPKVGFYEFNIILEKMEQIDRMADYIQMIVRYLLNQFIFKCNSYNLFFYRMNQKICVKIMPRFITSPLYVGFSIPQVPNNLEQIVEAIRASQILV